MLETCCHLCTNKTSASRPIVLRGLWCNHLWQWPEEDVVNQRLELSVHINPSSGKSYTTACTMHTHRDGGHWPMVEDGTMMTCGPSSPSSSRWARKAMAWMVLPRPWGQCHRLHRTMLHGRVVTTGEFSHTPSPLLLPWYNGTGWLGVKHQVTYLPPPPPPCYGKTVRFCQREGYIRRWNCLHFCQKSHQTLVHTKLSYSHLQFQVDKHSDRQHTLNMEMHTFQTSHSSTTSHTHTESGHKRARHWPFHRPGFRWAAGSAWCAASWGRSAGRASAQTCHTQPPTRDTSMAQSTESHF